MKPEIAPSRTTIPIKKVLKTNTTVFLPVNKKLQDEAGKEVLKNSCFKDKKIIKKGAI
jgi:hypothetical protein